MDQAIVDLKSTTFLGRRFTRKQIEQIQKTVKMLHRLSRYELARTICEHYNWFTANGKDRVGTCLTTLVELEKKGIIKLPPKMEHQIRGKHKQIVLTERTQEQSVVDGSLAELLPLTLQVVTEKQDRTLWNEYVQRYHYLEYKRPIGCHLRYFIVDRHGRKLGCLLFSFATKTLACRDKWIGWEKTSYKKHLNLVINNNRFLIFPWVNVKCLASKVLSMVTRQIAADWEREYNYRPVLVETFVDRTHYKGTCYQAANWKHIGQSAGRKAKKHSESKSQKDVYVYPLTQHFQAILTNKRPPAKKNKPTQRTINRVTLSTNDPFVQLWQKICHIVTDVAKEHDERWQIRKRVLNTMLLILFVFRLAFSKDNPGYKLTSIELWDQCRRMDITLAQEKPVSAAAICNARKKLDENIFKALNKQIIESYETLGKDHLWMGHRIYAVDGSKLNVPLQLLAEGYRKPSDRAHYPQGLVSCLYQLQSKLPTDFELVADEGERKVGLKHLAALTSGDVVVYDRGYYSYVLLNAHLRRGIHSVFRLKSTANKIVSEFITSKDTDRMVVIHPPTKRSRQAKLRKEMPDIEFKPLRLRLVKYTVSGTTFILGTTLYDQHTYSISDLSDVYHSRWGIEELYKVSKNLIDVEAFHGQSERLVKQELYAHFVLITLSRIFSNELDDGYQKEKIDDKKESFQTNFKGALMSTMNYVEELLLSQMSFVRKIVNCVLNNISQCRQRMRSDRSYQRRSKKPVKKWQVEKSKRVAQAKATPA